MFSIHAQSVLTSTGTQSASGEMTWENGPTDMRDAKVTCLQVNG